MKYMCLMFVVFLLFLLTQSQKAPNIKAIQITSSKALNSSQANKFNLNSHLSESEQQPVKLNILASQNETTYSLIFERQTEITLSRADFKVTSFVTISQYAQMLIEIGNYLLPLKVNVRCITQSESFLSANLSLSETNKIVVKKNLADIIIEVDLL